MAEEKNPATNRLDHSDKTHLASFRCADAGYTNCGWGATASNDEELMRKVEAHGRESHGIHQFSDDQRKQIRQKFRAA
jgi:predicted small metal-binding protein